MKFARTLNRKSPTGDLAYGIASQAKIDRPPYDRRVRPTNLLPFGNVILSSSLVRATTNATKQQQQNDNICKYTPVECVFISTKLMATEPKN